MDRDVVFVLCLLVISIIVYGLLNFFFWAIPPSALGCNCKAPAPGDILSEVPVCACLGTDGQVAQGDEAPDREPSINHLYFL